MTKLEGYGEDALVTALVARLPGAVKTGDEILAGAGDDCAVIRPPGGSGVWQLLKTDCVIEGVHYLPDTPPEKVGWKAMCRPLSDIAAMAGKPLHALVTLLLPDTATVEYAQSIYDGLGRAAERFEVRIVGGETARSPSAGLLSVALTGEVEAERLVIRSGGRVGDHVFVTGTLGGSFVTGKHLDFLPRLEEAQWLTSHSTITAMMDLSDGLGRDLSRLARASGTGYRIDHSRLPLTPGCNVGQALGDGEDYELLFTVPASHAVVLSKLWSEHWPRLSLTRIGELTEQADSSPESAATGYDHFRSRK